MSHTAEEKRLRRLEYEEKNKDHIQAVRAQYRANRKIELSRKARESYDAEKRRSQYERRREEVLAVAKEYASKNMGKVVGWRRDWVKRHPEKQAAINQKTLSSDRYIAGLLGLPVVAETKGLIELKRQQIELKRLSSQMKKALKEQNETSKDTR